MCFFPQADAAFKGVRNVLSGECVFVSSKKEKRYDM